MRAIDSICSMFSSELHEKSDCNSSQKVHPETCYSITRNDSSSPLVKSGNITNSGTKSAGSQTSLMVRQPFKPRTNGTCIPRIRRRGSPVSSEEIAPRYVFGNYYILKQCALDASELTVQ